MQPARMPPPDIRRCCRWIDYGLPPSFRSGHLETSADIRELKDTIQAADVLELSQFLPSTVAYSCLDSNARGKVGVRIHHRVIGYHVTLAGGHRPVAAGNQGSRCCGDPCRGSNRRDHTDSGDPSQREPSLSIPQQRPCGRDLSRRWIPSSPARSS